MIHHIAYVLDACIQKSLYLSYRWHFDNTIMLTNSDSAQGMKPLLFGPPEYPKGHSQLQDCFMFCIIFYQFFSLFS